MTAAIPAYAMHSGIDPFTGRGRGFWSSLISALVATALFRCWHILLFFTGWAAMVTLVSQYVFPLVFQPTLLTVLVSICCLTVPFIEYIHLDWVPCSVSSSRTVPPPASKGTTRVVGFGLRSSLAAGPSLVSCGSTCQVCTHKLSRPPSHSYFIDVMPEVPGETISVEERKARVMVEKKTIINLLEAFSIAIKHYLRGEEGIFYEDLYHLVKFLPPYALPAGLPSMVDVSAMPTNTSSDGTRNSTSRNEHKTSAEGRLPLPVTSEPRSPSSRSFKVRPGDDSFLLPARNPPKFAIFDVFPFSLLVHQLTKRGKDVKGKKAARLRASMREHIVSHNIPLEISLYLVRFQLNRSLSCTHPIDRVLISLLYKPGRRLTQARPVSICATNFPDPHLASLAALLNALLSLTDSLAGLERILTTPIPFSYSIHLWVVTIIYCLALPFQIWKTLGWITIPGTTAVVRSTSPIHVYPQSTIVRIQAFVFFGFLVAGEEIESKSLHHFAVPVSYLPHSLDPFGYDKNDLNMDYFTHVIIRRSLFSSGGAERLNFPPQATSFAPLPPPLLPIPLSGPSPTPTTPSSPLPPSRGRRAIPFPLESGCAVGWDPWKVRSLYKPSSETSIKLPTTKSRAVSNFIPDGLFEHRSMFFLFRYLIVIIYSTLLSLDLHFDIRGRELHPHGHCTSFIYFHTQSFYKQHIE